MKPLLKKVIAAVAVKEGIEKIQEMRSPKPTVRDRAGGPLKILTLGGGLFYLFKSGRLAPVIDRVKGLMGSKSDSPVSSEDTWSAPAATNGSTTGGTVSTSTTI
ncbi:MAG: hypothetical protein H0U53_06585 [Actinobacteria bacterium]|nr:hypothetical protein [Actinomycetota bacterium]